MHLVMAWFFTLKTMLKIVHLIMSKLVQCLGALSVTFVWLLIVFETTCPGFVRIIIWLCIFFPDFHVRTFDVILWCMH